MDAKTLGRFFFDQNCVKARIERKPNSFNETPLLICKADLSSTNIVRSRRGPYNIRQLQIMPLKRGWWFMQTQVLILLKKIHSRTKSRPWTDIILILIFYIRGLYLVCGYSNSKGRLLWKYITRLSSWMSNFIKI